MCSVSYEAVSPHDPADITVSVRDGSIQFVAVRSGYTTSAGAHVGMSVQALKDAYGSRLEPVGDSDNPTGFFMSSGSGYLSFVAPSGSVTAMAGAGSRITAQGIAGSGETYPC